MTDLANRDQNQEDLRRAEELMQTDSLWKIRWTLFRRSFAQNWQLFRTNGIGMAGIIIILFWAIMAILPTVFFATGLWTTSVYDPVTGLELDPPTQPLTVVAEVTDPETEINFQGLILDGNLPSDAQLGDVVFEYHCS